MKKNIIKNVFGNFFNGDNAEQVQSHGEESKKEENINPFKEEGVIGAKISGGYVYDDFLHRLLLERGRRTYREMRDNDAIISAFLFAIEMIIRAVDWYCEENEKTKGTPEAEQAVEFLEGVLFEDMEHTWDEFITEVLSMLVYGWGYTEIVYKQRLGEEQEDPAKKSIYNDGYIGIRKLANRAQETIDRWNIDEHGNIYGMWQQPPFGGETKYIPFEKALLFRPHAKKGSPEGRSLLRGAYTSWYDLKNIQRIESIAIERELNGLPVLYIPNSILNGTTPEARQARNAYIKMMRDIKFNEQGGAALPSDPWFDNEGNPTNVRKFEFKLMSAEGSRAIDTNSVILRLQRDIARTVLADFLMLGSDKAGSFALSKDKSSLFIHATEGWLKTICETINKYLIPRLWKLNKFDAKYMPKLRSGRVMPVNLEELGKYVSDLAGAGMPLFPDEFLEDELRNAADLPKKEGDAIQDAFTIEDETGEKI
jgi:hypothetical protein